MPGRLFLSHDGAALGAFFGVTLDAPIEPSPEIAPGQNLQALTTAGWTAMRWGLIPVGRKNARGRPVMETIVNARSETVFDKTAYANVGRAVVPASGWYEWTGQARSKTRWRISPKNGQPLALAVITDVWRGPGGVSVSQLATVTCEPNTDVRKYHHRMPVLLSLEAVAAWLSEDEAKAKAVLTVPEPGALLVEEAKAEMDRFGH